jgi:hypothetical protein
MSKITVPLCKRGFLTAVKNHPDLPIDKLADLARQICSGQTPDLDGITEESEHFTIKAPKRISYNPQTGLRQLHPLLEQLEDSLEKEMKFYICLNDKIIGAVDNDNHFHISIPTPVSQINFKGVPIRQIKID